MDEELQDDIARYYGWRASVELNELNLPHPQGDKFTPHVYIIYYNKILLMCKMMFLACCRR
jgi:hypothetical protein